MHVVLVVILLFGALLDDMIFACPARMIPGHARISVCVPKIPAGCVKIARGVWHCPTPHKGGPS